MINETPEVPHIVFFGERWDAPAFDDAFQIDTPVGENCMYCDDAIVEGDSGTLGNYTGYDPGTGISNVSKRPQHIECWVRAGLGSPAHIAGKCSCRGIEEEIDERSWREQGQAVIEMLRTGQTWWNLYP